MSTLQIVLLSWLGGFLTFPLALAIIIYLASEYGHGETPPEDYFE